MERKGRSIGFKECENFKNHQGQLLQEMGYGDWEEEAKQVLQPDQNLSSLLTGLNTFWIMREVLLSGKPTVWVLENFIEFFRHYIFITTYNHENFRLIVIHPSRMIFDKTFATLVEVMEHSSVYAQKECVSAELPIWKSICDERKKKALLKKLRKSRILSFYIVRALSLLQEIKYRQNQLLWHEMESFGFEMDTDENDLTLYQPLAKGTPTRLGYPARDILTGLPSPGTNHRLKPRIISWHSIKSPFFDLLSGFVSFRYLPKSNGHSQNGEQHEKLMNHSWLSVNCWGCPAGAYYYQAHLYFWSRAHVQKVSVENIFFF